jgi:hypothetical protein
MCFAQQRARRQAAGRQAAASGALRTERTINGVIMSSGFRDEFFSFCFSLLRAHECIRNDAKNSPAPHAPTAHINLRQTSKAPEATPRTDYTEAGHMHEASRTSSILCHLR